MRLIVWGLSLLVAAVAALPRPSPDRFVLVGSNGDLARKFLWPALFSEFATRFADPDLWPIEIVPMARGVDAEGQATFARESLEASGVCVEWNPFATTSECEEALGAFADHLRVTASGSMERLSEVVNTREVLPTTFFLAVPPQATAQVAEQLVKHEVMPPRRKETQETYTLVLEKPCGGSRFECSVLLQTLAGLGIPRENTLFVDHYLFKPSVQETVLGFRKSMGPRLSSLLDWDRLSSLEVVLLEQARVPASKTADYAKLGVIADVLQSHATELAAAALAPLARAAPVPAETAASVEERPAKEFATLEKAAELSAEGYWTRLRRLQAQDTDGSSDSEAMAMVREASAQAERDMLDISEPQRFQNPALDAPEPWAADVQPAAARRALIRSLRLARGPTRYSHAIGLGQYGQFAEEAAAVEGLNATLVRTPTLARVALQVAKNLRPGQLLVPHLSAPAGEPGSEAVDLSFASAGGDEQGAMAGAPTVVGVPVVLVAGKGLDEDKQLVRYSFGPEGRITMLLKGSMPVTVYNHQRNLELNSSTSGLQDLPDYPLKLFESDRSELVAKRTEEGLAPADAGGLLMPGRLLVKEVTGPAIVIERRTIHALQIPRPLACPDGWEMVLGGDPGAALDMGHPLRNASVIVMRPKALTKSSVPDSVAAYTRVVSAAVRAASNTAATPQTSAPSTFLSADEALDLWGLWDGVVREAGPNLVARESTGSAEVAADGSSAQVAALATLPPVQLYGGVEEFQRGGPTAVVGVDQAQGSVVCYDRSCALTLETRSARAPLKDPRLEALEQKRKTAADKAAEEEARGLSALIGAAEEAQGIRADKAEAEDGAAAPDELELQFRARRCVDAADPQRPVVPCDEVLDRLDALRE